MGKIEKISAGMLAFAQSLASLAKVALLSRRPSVAVTAGKDEELVVLGNGPSLNDTVADHSDFLASRRLLAVNFAANTPLFRQLKPDYYVLADRISSIRRAIPPWQRCGTLSPPPIGG